jgi:hypothetical protein
MSIEEFNYNNTTLCSISKICNDLAIFITINYLFLGYRNGMLWRTNLDMVMNGQNQKEVEF